MLPPVNDLRKCWVIAGPTAVGKTELSLLLARELNAEIIALDSMTLYRGMDIGTAKPSPAERTAVPHHLLDVIDPHQEFSLAEYLRAAYTHVQDICARGKIPLFVGGTGLYLRGLLRGLFEGPPANWDLRNRLEQRELVSGPGTLHRDLAERDAVSAERLHPHDLRRIIRALEVYELTGSALSAQQQEAVLPLAQRPANVFWLEPDRDWLYQRIDARVEAMFRAGLLDEVRALSLLPEGIGRTARQALGYKETLDHLELGVSFADTVSAIQTRTRQFAKRQHTWFRNLEECRSLAVETTDTPETLIRKLLNKVAATSL